MILKLLNSKLKPNLLALPSIQCLSVKVDYQPDPSLSKRENRKKYWILHQEKMMEKWREIRNDDPQLLAKWEFRKELRQLGREGKWEQILEKVGAAKEAGFPPMDIGVFQKAILGLSKCNRYVEAREILGQMKGRGFQPTPKVYNAVIAASVSSLDWSKASQEFRNMVNWSVKPNLETFNLLVRVMALTGNWHKALLYSREMQQKNYIKPNLHHFNLLMLGFGLNGRHKRARRLFDDVIRRKFVVGLKEFNTLLYALGRNMQSANALKYFQKMKGQELEPDVFSFLSVAAVCELNNDSQTAKQILSEMSEKGIEPKDFKRAIMRRNLEPVDIRAMSMVPLAYGIMERYDEMIQCLDELANDGFELNSAVFEMALNQAGKSGDPIAIAERVRRSMEKYGIQPVPFEKYS
mmetsp:Transcript_2478/g.3633  ORF Transcript_2478/g.3633 Transcript_2478/m.3633 type:complete len:408 (+) Transcript_2478:45-1268(+)|eukprot:CAMPEP_0171474576 /NCGR_PEP_ID=MMETSP0946-20130122/2506_1 /TAXON_ID=109269 /ORGANISM="Vaucheria litorea, Strain CCMP2940" /LENGTH=407 /DNA_ID=CAMNT_0012004531 /DNA_START=31 /DNA_END=1254 /DNA_ORIENTATION=-